MVGFSVIKKGHIGIGLSTRGSATVKVPIPRVGYESAYSLRNTPLDNPEAATYPVTPPHVAEEPIKSQGIFPQKHM